MVRSVALNHSMHVRLGLGHPFSTGTLTGASAKFTGKEGSGADVPESFMARSSNIGLGTLTFNQANAGSNPVRATISGELQWALFFSL